MTPIVREFFRGSNGIILFGSGPVAQLGARFHGMEEVKGSNPFRSTKSFQILTAPSRPLTSLPESNWSAKPLFTHGQSWARLNLLPARDQANRFNKLRGLGSMGT